MVTFNSEKKTPQTFTITLHGDREDYLHLQEAVIGLVGAQHNDFMLTAEQLRMITKLQHALLPDVRQLR